VCYQLATEGEVPAGRRPMRDEEVGLPLCLCALTMKLSIPLHKLLGDITRHCLVPKTVLCSTIAWQPDPFNMIVTAGP
jgi:hypothetical protein